MDGRNPGKRLMNLIMRQKANNRVERVIRRLVRNGAKLNKPQLDGELPLVRACKLPCPRSIVKLLVELGADVNKGDEQQEFPLIWATIKQVPEMIQFLLGAGADVNVKGNHEKVSSAIHAAASYSDLTIMQILLEAGADVNALNFHNQTPLHMSAISSNVECVQLLLNWNAPVNSVEECTLLLVTEGMNRGKENENSDSEEESEDSDSEEENENSDREEENENSDRNKLMRILELLLDAAEWNTLQWFINTSDLSDKVQKDEGVQNLLSFYKNQLPTLQNLCRKTIRKSVGKGFLPDRLRSVVDFYYGNRPPVLGRISLPEFLL